MNDAGVWSVPLAFTARTWNVWVPKARPVRLLGVVQVANAAASSAHWNVAPVGVDVNVKVALVLVVDNAGDEVIVVSGGAVIVQVNEAGEGSVPATLTARTRKLWLLAPSAEYAWGLVHAVKLALSSEHWNVAPAGVDVKVNVALVLVVEAAGDEVIAVSGTGVP